jgi:hypothetical protein
MVHEFTPSFRHTIIFADDVDYYNIVPLLEYQFRQRFYLYSNRYLLTMRYEFQSQDEANAFYKTQKVKFADFESSRDDDDTKLYSLYNYRNGKNFVLNENMCWADIPREIFNPPTKILTADDVANNKVLQEHEKILPDIIQFISENFNVKIKNTEYEFAMWLH